MEERTECEERREVRRWSAAAGGSTVFVFVFKLPTSATSARQHKKQESTAAAKGPAQSKTAVEENSAAIAAPPSAGAWPSGCFLVMAWPSLVWSGAFSWLDKSHRRWLWR